jgi:hypothetical protein
VRSASSVIVLAVVAATLAAAGLALRAVVAAVEPAESAAAATIPGILAGRADRDGRVRVTGVVVGGRRRASLGLRLGDGDGVRIDVVPALGTAVPAVLEGDARLRVVGTVLRDGPRPAIVATRIRRVPAPLLRTHVARRLSLRRIRAHPKALDRKPATITGRVRDVTRDGLVIRRHGRTLYASTRRATASHPHPSVGDRVVVRGRVQRLSAIAARELQAATHTDVPDRTGDPYLIAREVKVR